MLGAGSYLETCYVFGPCCSVVRRDRGSISPRAKAEPSSECSHRCRGSFCSGWWHRALVLALCEPQRPLFLPIVLAPALGCFLTRTHCPVLCRAPRATVGLWPCTLLTPSCLFLAHGPAGASGVPSSFAGPGSSGSQLRELEDSPHWLPISDHCPCLRVNVLKNVASQVLPGIGVVSGGRVNRVPVIPCLGVVFNFSTLYVNEYNQLERTWKCQDEVFLRAPYLLYSKEIWLPDWLAWFTHLFFLFLLHLACPGLVSSLVPAWFSVFTYSCKNQELKFL